MTNCENEAENWLEELKNSSPECILICLFKCVLWRNAIETLWSWMDYLQNAFSCECVKFYFNWTRQKTGCNWMVFLQVCILIRIFKLSFRLKEAEHWMQLNGFASICTLKWFSKMFFLLNEIDRWLQLYGFYLVLAHMIF